LIFNLQASSINIKGEYDMATLLVLPKLGLTMTEGTISKWHKAEGEGVRKGEPLYSLETDKLTNEIESTEDGILRKILLESGSTAPCLAPVAVIGGADEDISALLAGAGAQVKTEGAAAAAAPADRGKEEAASPAPAKRVVASPAARKLAAEKGVDISQVRGSGPNGRVELKDVENFGASRAKSSSVAAKMMAEQGIAPSDTGVAGRRIMKSDVEKLFESKCPKRSEESKPMSRMRKVIASRMSDSWHISPAVTLDISVDLTELAKMRNSLKSEGVKVSYTDFLVYIVSRTLVKYPVLNCTIDGDNIIYRDYVNMGVAVALPEGLLVPVINDAHEKGLSSISAELISLAERAREGSLTTDDLKGGTFTISNLGMYGIESFSPIINQPEVAILGVNAAKDTVVPINGELVIKPLLKLSLTTDHRAVDGAVAAEFLSGLKKRIENPALLML
jgi:pyruvate dehydrogenase E2 component (dihydrolipoamide acetyltransferase)